jgi:flagellar basal body-associated protein FliL
MRVRNRAVILILMPITIFLWLIGWALFWTGSKNQPPTPKPTTETHATITTTILLENYEEYNT